MGLVSFRHIDVASIIKGLTETQDILDSYVGLVFFWWVVRWQLVCICGRNLPGTIRILACLGGCPLFWCNAPGAAPPSFLEEWSHWSAQNCPHSALVPGRFIAGGSVARPPRRVQEVKVISFQVVAPKLNIFLSPTYKSQISVLDFANESFWLLVACWLLVCPQSIIGTEKDI